MEIERFNKVEEDWNCDEFLDFSLAALRLLFQSNDIVTYSENIVCAMFMKWTEHRNKDKDKENKK